MKRMRTKRMLLLTLVLALLLPVQALAEPEEVAPRAPLPQTITITFELRGAGIFPNGTDVYKTTIPYGQTFNWSSLPTFTPNPGVNVNPGNDWNIMSSDGQSSTPIRTGDYMTPLMDKTLVLNFTAAGYNKVTFAAPRELPAIDGAFAYTGNTHFLLPSNQTLQTVANFTVPGFVYTGPGAFAGTYTIYVANSSTKVRENVAPGALAAISIHSDVEIVPDISGFPTSSGWVSFTAGANGSLVGQTLFALNTSAQTVSGSMGYKLPTPKPDAGYVFIGWTMNGYDIANPGETAVYSGMSRYNFVANFGYKKSVEQAQQASASKVVFSAGANGSLDSAPVYAVVTGQTLSTATGYQTPVPKPNAYFAFDKWVDASGAVVTDPAHYVVNGDTTVTAVFKWQAPAANANGWYKDADGDWIYLKAGKAIASKWQKVKGKWYYFRGNGKMAGGWQKSSGKWYYLNKDTGAMVKGWQKDGSKWYYLSASGAMTTGWQKTGGSWYYLKPSGEMATGHCKTGARTSKFASSGKWLGYK